MAKESFTKINFIEEKYCWKTLNLWDYLLEGNYPSSWKDFFLREDVQKDLQSISDQLEEESKRCIIYPEINKVFRAFIPLEDIKVVILGQDPYHNSSAVGFCFSVLPGNSINPSLRNIYKELKNEGYDIKEDGVLTHWADQGCLLLNTALTVEKSYADSHTGIWYEFSEKVIQYIAKNTRNVAWLLMGSKALEFKEHILGENHYIVVSSHPSPFSAHRSFRNHPAFLGSKVFYKINKFLKKFNRKPIIW